MSYAPFQATLRRISERLRESRAPTPVRRGREEAGCAIANVQRHRAPGALMFSRNIPQRDRTQYVRSALAPLSAVNGPVLPAMLPLSHVGAGSLTALDFEDRPLAILSSMLL